MIVSAYTNNLQPAKFDPYVRNTELITQTLLTKQKLYDETYKGIQGLKQQALSINFLNKSQQAKVDRYNTEINDYFSKMGNDLGDLTDPKIATQITSMFERIGSDVELVNNYRKDKKYQDMLRDVEAKKNSKDPAKAGFNSTYYSNFLRRVEEYSNLDMNDPASKDFVLKPYTEYVDVNKESTALAKSVAIKKFDTEKVLNNGYKQVIRREGRDPNEVRAAMQEYYTSVGLPHIQEEAEAIYHNMKDNPDAKERTFLEYNSYKNERLRQINEQKNAANLQIKEGKNVEENALMISRLDEKLAEINTGPTSYEEFFNRPSQFIIEDIAGQKLQDTIQAKSEAFGGYAVTEKYEPDPVYMQYLNLKHKAEQFNANLELDKANLQEKQRHNIAMENKESDGSSSSSKSNTGAGPSDGNVTFQTEDASKVQPFSVHSEYSLPKLKELVKKGYSSQVNIFKDGLEGKTAEILGYEMMKNPKSLDANPYYKDSPYVKAYKLVVDNIRGNNAAYLDIMEKDAIDNSDWDNKKIVMKYINDEVERIIKEPKTKREIEISNSMQDLNAQMNSLGDFMKRVNESGNPEKFIKEYPAFNIMLMGKVELDVKDKTGKDKAEIVSRRDDIASSLHEVLGTNISGDNNQVVDIPKQAMTYAQRAFDGTVRVWVKPEIFEGTVVKESDEDGNVKEVVVPKLRGKYIVIDNKKIPIETIQEQKYIEFKDAKYATSNPMTQLSLMMSTKPQTRWGWGNKTKKSIPYTIRLSDEDNLIHFKIGDGEEQAFVSSNSNDAINAIQKVISEDY